MLVFLHRECTIRYILDKYSTSLFILSSLFNQGSARPRIEPVHFPASNLAMHRSHSPLVTYSIHNSHSIITFHFFASPKLTVNAILQMDILYTNGHSRVLYTVKNAVELLDVPSRNNSLVMKNTTAMSKFFSYISMSFFSTLLSHEKVRH